MAGRVRGGSDLRELIEWAKKRGFSCEITKGTHLVFIRDNTRSIYASYTPSCYYARKNTKGDLMRAIRESEQRQTS
jgi:hypothetical protein